MARRAAHPTSRQPACGRVPFRGQLARVLASSGHTTPEMRPLDRDDTEDDLCTQLRRRRVYAAENARPPGIIRRRLQITAYVRRADAGIVVRAGPESVVLRGRAVVVGGVSPRPRIIGQVFSLSRSALHRRATTSS